MSAAPRSAAGLYDLMVREGMNPSMPRPKERKRRDNAESRAQQAVVDWWNHNHEQFGITQCLLFAVGNGGARSAITGAIMKREGVRRGTSDLLLLVPRGRFHGMALEMKTEDGAATPEQRVFLAAVTEQGYLARICHSVESAMNEITEYLKL